jgi:hypothetical protein
VIYAEAIASLPQSPVFLLWALVMMAGSPRGTQPANVRVLWNEEIRPPAAAAHQQ